MKTTILMSMVVALLMLVSAIAVPAFGQKPPKMKMTTPIPEAFTAPDNVKTSIGTLKYFDGVPTEESTKAIYDYLTLHVQ